MFETIDALHRKKLAAIGTTQAEVDKVLTNIERKKRIIAEKELEIENQRAAIEDKEDKLDDLSSKLDFQTERAQTLERYAMESLDLTEKIDKLYDRKAELSDWGMDLAKMREVKNDPNSEWSKVSRELDELYKRRQQLVDFANDEYNKPFRRADS